MLKIVHLDTGADLRGGQQQLLMLARGLRNHGHQQLIATPEGTALEARARHDGFHVFALPAHDPGHAHGILQLRQRLQAGPFDVLHAHDGKGQTISWLASLGMRVGRIASRRVTFLPARRIDSRFKYGRTCDAVIAISGFIRQLLIDSGVPDSRIHVIPDGVDIPDEMPDAVARARVRAQWEVGAQEFVAGHLGAITHEKGRDIAIQAATLLIRTFPEARIVLAAGAPKPALLDTPPNLRVIGYQENLAEFFSGLDLYIMPSRAEGLGSSVLLAMAHGLAVVASRVGGLPEIIEDGTTGWLIPPGSPKALADAVAEAASDRARLHEMGGKARERARAFSSTILTERTEALYEKVLVARGQPKVKS
ncbi:MAG: glycosyltransferase family 4 protein [Terriglobia bacterium]